MIGYVWLYSNWPLEPWHWTDGQQGWWRVVTDNARKKMAKMMISSALKQLFSKCKQLQCNDCRAGWGIGTWGGSEGCDVRMWHVTRVWHVAVWWAADWIMSLSSQPDDRRGAQNALNTVITVLKKSQLSCSGSHIPHSISASLHPGPSQVRWR